MRQLPVGENAKGVGRAECSGMTITSKSRYKKTAASISEPRGAPQMHLRVLPDSASARGSAAAGTAKKMRAKIDMGQKNVAGKGPLWV